MKQTKFPMPLAGIDAMSEQTSLKRGTVRKATNVDLGRGGSFSRRAGATLMVPGDSMHSLWSSKGGKTFVAGGAQLFRLGAGLSLAPVQELGSQAPVSFTEYNGNIYWTNATSTGWMPANDDVARVVGVRTLETLPTLSPTTGDLLPGTYGVCFTVLSERGEESPATRVQTVSLPDGGGVRCSGLPTDPDAKYRVAAYITDTDDSIPRLAEVFPPVFSQYVIGTRAQGAACDTIGLAPLPAGEHISWLAGRLYTALGDTLSFSEPMRPHLTDPAHNVIRFVGDITFIMAVADGMFVGDSRGVWFLSGTEPGRFELKCVSNVPAVRRSAVLVQPGDLPPGFIQTTLPVAVWLSLRGYMAGSAGGDVAVMQTDRMMLSGEITGRSAFISRFGMKQVITPVDIPITAAIGSATNSDL